MYSFVAGGQRHMPPKKSDATRMEPIGVTRVTRHAGAAADAPHGHAHPPTSRKTGHNMAAQLDGGS
jgi:hypothetical protein